VPAPRFGQEGHYLSGSGHPIRVVESVDVRFLLEDMFAKIRKFGRESAGPLAQQRKEIDNDWYLHPPRLHRPFRRGGSG
jgi:hypothetical protein